jgi:GTP cyclohydrolase II
MRDSRLSGGSPVRRAIAALRSGRAIRIDSDPPFTILSVETGGGTLEMLDPDNTAPLLLSGRRAAALSLANAIEAADPADPVLIERAAWLNAEAALALADPGLDGERAPIGPLQPTSLAQLREARLALSLVRRAGLLPALWVVADSDAAIALPASADVRPEVRLVSRARLPMDGIDDAQILAFRSEEDGAEHVALLIGAFGGKPPLVRLHSECLTGDVFGSLKCDCGPQLRQALRLIEEAGGGVLLYLRQEGRGIGLANKLRAYALQDRGLDTVDANLRLGFADDERGYGDAAAMLGELGIGEVRLLTNNPAKVDGLAAAGIEVVERVPHHMPTNPHNADYVATKQSKSGHLP